MKVIQTRYDGILFRSRTEARWAVFFNTATPGPDAPRRGVGAVGRQGQGLHVASRRSSRRDVHGPAGGEGQAVRLVAAFEAARSARFERSGTTA